MTTGQIIGLKISMAELMRRLKAHPTYRHLAVAYPLHGEMVMNQTPEGKRGRTFMEERSKDWIALTEHGQKTYMQKAGIKVYETEIGFDLVDDDGSRIIYSWGDPR